MKSLRYLFWCSFAIVAAIVAVFESDLIEAGWLSSEAYTMHQMVMQTVMIVLTFVIVPLSIYMFRLKAVRRRFAQADSSHHEAIWLRFARIRLLMLALPMIIGMLLYYLYGLDVRFFYMSVIFAITMLLFYPSRSRQMKETSEAARDNNSNR